MKRKKKILLIGPFPPPIGGDTVLTRDLFRSSQWRENGMEIITVNTSHSGGVRLPESRISISDLARAVRVLFQVTLRLPGSRAVLFWSNRRFLCTAGTAVIYLCNLFGKPVLVKAFGGSLGKRIKGMSRRGRRFVTGMLKRCRYVLPETGELTRELKEDLGIPPSQVRMLPNFLPERFFDEASPENRSGKFRGRAIFLGQIKKEKGVFDIISALSNSPQYSCDFYGPVADRDSEEFAESLAGGKNLEYRGIASPEEVPELIRKHDVLLLPTWHSGEGYPAVILQAFACRTAVVASDWMSIPDLIGEGQRGILIPAKDPGALRKALDKLASGEELRERIIENARVYAQKYSEKKIIGDILISELLAEY